LTKLQVFSVFGRPFELMDLRGTYIWCYSGIYAAPAWWGFHTGWEGPDPICHLKSATLRLSTPQLPWRL